MKKNNVGLKLVVITLFIVLGLSSISQAMVKTVSNVENETDENIPMQTLSDDPPLYEWQDNFNNEQLIESSMSYDYEIVDGNAQMKSTYSIWTDPSFSCMKPITLKNNIGTPIPNYAAKIIIEYDSDMKANYGDIRFKHENSPTQWLDYWVEEYDSTSATVWVNLPSLPTGQSMLYLFYGNPAANDQSDFYSVFSEWEPEWANDEKVSVHVYTEGAWDPDVVYGGGVFLVTWEEGSAPYPPYTYFYKQDIRGSLYYPDGTPVSGAQDFTIRSGQGEQWHHEDPSAAYGNGKFFVAWEHYETSTDASTMQIKARLVTTTGSVSSTDIQVCMANSIQADPHVCYDSVNNRFLVTWEDARGGTSNYDIYGKLYDTNGNQIGSEFIISNAANSQCEPWAAYDHINQQYMIVWEEGVHPANGPFDIWVGLYDSSLNCIGPGSGSYKPIKIADGNIAKDYNFPCVAFCEENQRFLITYNDCDISSGDWQGDVWGKVLDSSGNTKVDTFLIRNGNFIRTDIAPYLSTNFLVAFNGGNNIWGRFVSSEDGTIYNGDIKLSSSTSAEADWVNMDTNGDEIFVAWEDNRVDYAAPFNGMPDTYANIWHLNIGGGSDVTITYGSEKNLILEAIITSKEIIPENIFRWHDFTEVSSGNIQFDILDSAGNVVADYQNINNGKDMSNLDEDVIRLRARFTRNDASETPTLDLWKVRYMGNDDESPRTEIDFIDGTRGLNDWYIEESVTIWLKASDFPEQTGSGVDATYYELDYGATQLYNEESGIHLVATQPDWMGEWTVNFWSVDNAGNVERHDDAEHKLDIKIDAERPYVEIINPVNEQQVETPFEMRAYATDNAQIERVEFDIEPFGERPNAPFAPDGYNAATHEYWWNCDIGPKSKTLALIEPVGTNVMIRAQVYDQSGQTWIDEIWIYIDNWGGKTKVIPRPILDALKTRIQFQKTLDITLPAIDTADKAKITATKILTGRQNTIWDYDLSNGIDASFDVNSGIYRISKTLYKNDEEITNELVSRMFYLAR